MYIYIYIIHVHIYIYTFMYIYTYIYIFVLSVYIYIYLCLYIYISINLYIYILKYLNRPPASRFLPWKTVLFGENLECHPMPDRKYCHIYIYMYLKIHYFGIILLYFGAHSSKIPYMFSQIFLEIFPKKWFQSDLNSNFRMQKWSKTASRRDFPGKFLQKVISKWFWKWFQSDFSCTNGAKQLPEEIFLENFSKKWFQSDFESDFKVILVARMEQNSFQKRLIKIMIFGWNW